MSALMGTMVMPNFKHFTAVSKLMVNLIILARLAHVQMALDLDVNSLVHVIKVILNFFYDFYNIRFLIDEFQHHYLAPEPMASLEPVH